MTPLRPAELVITGRVATLEGERGFGWRGGVAIGGGRVLAAGEPAQLERYVSAATERWRLGDDQLVMPGITDAHLHLMTLVASERHVDLTGAGLDQALAAVDARHRELLAAGDAEGWVLGHGWSLHSLGGWPDASALERSAPSRPVALWAHDHHSRWVSLRALTMAGIAAADDPPGGLVRRDENGRPTGILHETASVLVDPVIPEPTASEFEAGLARVAAGLLALGLTGCHDPGELTADSSMPRGPLAYRAIAERGELPLRVHSSIRAPQLDRAIELGLRSGQRLDAPAGDAAHARRVDRYRMGWLKLFADGSLGSRSAALLAPYSDADMRPPTGGPTGMLLTDAEELDDLLRRAAEAGISGQVHAIGDAAVRMALDVFSGAPLAVGEASRLVRRVEHAQLVDPADVDRFASLGVAASVQPVHLRSDAEPARIAWGERVGHAFPLAALDAGGALIPFGTDAPVEPADPWPGIAIAVTRREPFDAQATQTGAHHALTLERAIRAACLDPAIVAGESRLGRLTPGAPADLIVVPAAGLREPLDPAVLAATRPLVTLVDGEVSFRSAQFDP